MRQEPTKSSRQAFVALANRLADEGDHYYVWGAQGPSSFDCSGLVMYLGQHSGLWGASHDTTADGLWKGVGGGQRISRKDLQPGDLVLYGKSGDRASHVEVYVGPGEQTIGASGGGRRTTSRERAKAANAKVKRKAKPDQNVIGYVRLPFADNQVRPIGRVLAPSQPPTRPPTLSPYLTQPSEAAQTTIRETLGIEAPDLGEFMSRASEVTRPKQIVQPEPIESALPPETAQLIQQVFPEYASVIEWIFS